MKESTLHKKFKEAIESEYPDAIFLKTDPEQVRSIPDVLVLVGDTWGAFELKQNRKSRRQPNQPYYVATMNAMAYASFVTTNNIGEVLDDFRQYIHSKRED